MIGGTPCRRWLNAFKAERKKVQLIDEGINHADRIVLSDIIIQARRQHRRLTAIFPFHKSAHASLHAGSRRAWTDLLFSHSHSQLRTSSMVKSVPPVARPTVSGLGGIASVDQI
jgi:hypothetical protein